MKIRVNDIELEMEPGTSAIDAVFAAGYDVPYFCSQEYMSPVGACRMCLARVGAPRKDREGNWILDEATGEPQIFWFPNPMATCTTAVMEGMQIDTLSPEIKRAQDNMVEFTLINHPLDCPTCDKGGACELQDRSYEYGSGRSRFEFSKRHREKHYQLSELITLDQERCIHCKRCVRFFEEVPGDEVLDFIDRGGHTFIDTLDYGLAGNFTGNVTDICPVGALLDTTSRFRGRNWEYDHTPSVSLDDASGSAIVIDARTGRIERIRAGLNDEVNKIWIDDGVRFGHEYADSQDRFRTPLVRRNGTLEEVTWEEAASFIAERLAQFSGDEIGIAIRADSTLEEGVAASTLAAHLGSKNLDHAPRPAASVISAVPSATFTDLATADAILVIGDVTEELPIADLRIKDALKGVTPAPLLAHGPAIADLRLKERMKRNTGILTVAAPYRVDLMKHAGNSVTYPAGAEAALLGGLLALAAGREPAAAEAEVLGQAFSDSRVTPAELVAQLKDARNAVIVYGGFVLDSVPASQAAAALTRATAARPLIVGPAANSFGLELTGVLPGKDGRDYHGMLQDTTRALIISQLNPAGAPAAAEQLGRMELLVAHASLPDETTALAHVVLPAVTGYEKEGTVVSLEGRASQVRPAPVDSGTAQDFTGVVRHLGEALGKRLDGRSVRSARRQLKNTLGFEPAALPEGGTLLKVRPRNSAPAGTAANDGAQASADQVRVLITPSMIRQEYLQRNPHLLADRGFTALRVNPVDAALHDLANGDLLQLEVGGVARRAEVRISQATPAGLFLLPCLPEQRSGLALADPGTFRKERHALEVV
jgi:NADH-quinone oxidoreductase subunit G